MQGSDEFSRIQSHPRDGYRSHQQKSANSATYGMFSPGGGAMKSPFGWDAQMFRFDLDDMRARSNLLSLSSDIRDHAEETEAFERTETQLAKRGPSGFDEEDNEDEESKERKKEASKCQKRKSRSSLVGPEAEMKKFKIGVLRNLLANFSLEKTIEKYRNMSSKQFTVRLSDYSFDCAVPAHQLKDKLFRLTGSDQIKINDRHFVRRMQKILEQEDEEKMKKEDDERAEREYQRLRKLMQHGVISAKEMQGDECLSLVQGRSKRCPSKGLSLKMQGYSPRRITTGIRFPQHNGSACKLVGQTTMKDPSVWAISSSQKPRGKSTESLRLPPISSHRSSATNARASTFLLIPPAKHASDSQIQAVDCQSNRDRDCSNRSSHDTPVGSTAETIQQITEPAHKPEPHQHGKITGATEGGSATTSAAAADLSSTSPVCDLHEAAPTKSEHLLIQKMREAKSVKGLYQLAEKLSTMAF